MTFTSVHGLTLHYRLEDAQPDKLPLVFLNSLGSDLRIWDEVVAELRGYRPLLRYDKRGHGLSDAPTGPYTISDHTEDLVGLLQTLGVSQAILVGISVGGMIALDFAARYPEHVEMLVLCDTGAKIGTLESWNERISAVRNHGLEKIAEQVVSGWVTPAFRDDHPAAFQGYVNMLGRTSAAGYIGTCAALRDGDLRDQAARVSTNTLILCGSEDRSTPPTLSEELASLIQGSRLELFQRAAHLPCLEQPRATAQAIKTFLEEHDD